MASINLAGAIGLGGKRESIISGLPDAINKAGDALNKTIGDELKRQEGERAAKREKELQMNEMFKKEVKNLINKDELHPNDFKYLEEEKGKAFAKAFEIDADPTKSYMAKAAEKNQIYSDLSEKANYAKQAWEVSQKAIEMGKNPIYDKSMLDKMLGEGKYGTQQEDVVMDNQTSPERKDYNMSPSVAAQENFGTLDELSAKKESEATKTITTPQYPNIEGKAFFDVPLDQRMKELPVPIEEFDKRIKLRQGDEKKAFEEFVGSPLGAFTAKLKVDGKDNFVFQQDKYDFQAKALEAALADPIGEGLGVEMRILKANLINNYTKDLMLKNNFSRQKAGAIAEGYANEVIKDKFAKSVEAAKLDRMKDQDLTGFREGKGLTINNGIISNNKWGISNEPIKIDAIDNLLTPDQEEEIADRIMAKYGKKANPKDIEILTQAEIKKEKEKILKNKDIGFVAVQTIATGGNPIQPFRVGKGVSDGVYIDTKTNKILGFRVAQLNSDGTEGQITFEKATPELVLSFKTNLGNDKAGKNLWESIYSEKSVSSQKGSEKKVETQTSFYKPRQELKANEIDVKKLKPNEVYIVDGIERVYIDGQLKKVKKKVKK